MISNIEELDEAITPFDGGCEIKVMVNGDDDVYYQIVSIESDGSGNVVVNVI